jgi:hypothetical protein
MHKNSRQTHQLQDSLAQNIQSTEESQIRANSPQNSIGGAYNFFASGEPDTLDTY